MRDFLEAREVSLDLDPQEGEYSSSCTVNNTGTQEGQPRPGSSGG